jgi:DNA invertase Pin-like site-specific DNA recombinase
MSPRIPTAPSTAIGLVRVSTDEQADSGLGLEAQRHALKEAAARQGLHLVRVVEEAGVSGGAAIEKRQGLLEAIDAVPKGGVLLVAKLDRIARDKFVSAWVEKELAVRDARVVSAAGEGTDPEGDELGNLILRRVTEMFAEYERALIRVRTTAALAAKRRRGEKLGGRVPMGFAVVQVSPDGPKRLVPDPAEQAALKLAVKLRDEGKSLRQVGTALVAAGHRPRIGKQWHAKVVRDMVARLQELDAVTNVRIARLRASEGR